MKIEEHKHRRNEETEMESLVPALRDVVDLTLDRHEQRLSGVRAVVLFELHIGDLTKLNWRRQRLHLLFELSRSMMDMGIIGRTE